MRKETHWRNPFPLPFFLGLHSSSSSFSPPVASSPASLEIESGRGASARIGFLSFFAAFCAFDDEESVG